MCTTTSGPGLDDTSSECRLLEPFKASINATENTLVDWDITQLASPVAFFSGHRCFQGYCLPQLVPAAARPSIASE